MSEKMERVDSGTTDDSPFASSLTTPVDEDIQLQLPGHRLGMMSIEKRLFGLCKEKENRGIVESESAISDRPGRGAVSAVVSDNKFREELEKKVCYFSHAVLCRRSPKRRFHSYQA